MEFTATVTDRAGRQTSRTTTIARPTRAPGSLGDGSNRASDLAAWLTAQPNGSTLDLTGMSIRADQTIALVNRQLRILGGLLYTDHPTGDSSTLAAPSTAARTRAHWRVTGGNVTFKGSAVRGPNVNGGLADNAYVAALEAQHGWDCADGTMTLDSCQASYMYGDAAYAGGGGVGSRDVKILGGEYHHTGRQGIGVTWVDGLLVQGASIHDIRRSIVDFEPNFTYGWVRNCRFLDNTIGAARLSFVAAKGAAAPADNIEVSRNTVAGNLIITVQGGSNFRRKNWTVAGNTAGQVWGSTAGTACMAFSNVDGLTVTGNVQKLQAGRGNYLVAAGACTAVDVHGNTWTGGAGELVVS